MMTILISGELSQATHPIFSSITDTVSHTATVFENDPLVEVKASAKVLPGRLKCHVIQSDLTVSFAVQVM